MIKKSIKNLRDKFLYQINQNVLTTQQSIKNVEKNINHTENVLLRAEERIKHIDTRVVNLEKKVNYSGSLVLSDKEIITKIFSGIKISMDPRDVAVATHIALDGIWEEQITKAWVDTVNKNDVILDIGANFGYFGALAAQYTDKKNSKVVMFEANPKLIPYINKTLDINWLNEQCEIANYAVSDKSGTATLNIPKDYIGCSTLQDVDHLGSYMNKKMHLSLSEAVKVPAITIDEYCKTNKITSVDIIKMDIEGFEDKAYEGMKNIIKNSPNLKLFIEFTRQSYKNPEKFFNKLKDDFKHIYMIDKNGKIYKPKSSSYEDIIESSDDWVMPIFSMKALV